MPYANLVALSAKGMQIYNFLNALESVDELTELRLHVDQLLQDRSRVAFARGDEPGRFSTNFRFEPCSPRSRG